MAPYFISCDWGTSSLRLRLVSIPSQKVEAELGSDSGILQTYRNWKESGNIPRISFYRDVLDEHLMLLASRSNRSLREIPIAISGMASASIGMMELAYAGLPASIDGSGFQVELIERIAEFDNDILLVSGLRTEDDVMRGEETALTGISQQHLQNKILVILPGTHSKHVLIENEKIVSFSTYMTGELFSLLSTKSILSDSVSTSKDLSPDRWTDSFDQGVHRGKDENLLNAIFKTRTNFLFNKLSPDLNYHFLSGILIGAELREIERTKLPVLLIGNDEQLRFYRRALELVCPGTEARAINVTETVVAGQYRLLQHFGGQ